MTGKLLSEETLSFLNNFGNLILPGSDNPCVPPWDAEPPSDYFLCQVAKSLKVVECFRSYLISKYEKRFDNLRDEDLQAIIVENSQATADFFSSNGQHYIIDYYSRPKVLSSLGLSQVPPFPTGGNPFAGNLEELYAVFSREQMYR